VLSSVFDRLPDDALEALAIFPLPDVVLFPGALLPLHVFEPRYRAMARDVLAGNGLLAVARLRAGFEPEYHERPAVHPIAGVGQIIACDELADGRYNLLLRGLARITIDDELPPDEPYRLVRARVLPDADSDRPDTLAARHTQLVDMCDRLSMLLEGGGEQLRELVRSVEAPGQCADLVAAALVADADERQRLLETLDPADRLDLVLERIAHLIVDLGPKTSMPN
jgi:uncharacterized protein